ncbi:hypothetical protein QUF49_04635 [Fictibacillus sp. b24]|uniref:hypothetical protein n=1 Tax=Fictibacillus sp. b24 TaxID=3055863 RepID=UPI0025A01B2E|nr:hypothetical protein [Fictibacillus sp. b24]MDM5315270.1 hypothetical protein [Fictibacillus sp. b24]
MRAWFAIIVIMMMFDTSVHASSKVISEGKAWGFHYRITAENKVFTWKIGDGKKESVIEENEENRNELERFRSAVNESDLQTFSFFLYAVYLLIIGIVALIVYKKVKDNRQTMFTILVLFAMYASYKCFIAFVYLQEALDDAKVYFIVLT